MISLFIDDELDISEKIVFVETVHEDKSFADEAIDLLHQEKIIQQDIVERAPVVDLKVPFSWKRFIRPFQPLKLVGSALAMAIIFIVFFVTQSAPAHKIKRFVIYRPDVSKVEITGTFTGWSRIPMRKIGDSGYWEISLDLLEGEHRFTYILEDRRSFADPTIQAREKDDFGGQNSVIHVERSA